ncbi:MAG TPA: cardiolipin synthase [Burkholderiales bacterium]|nr:cardiolipin synthase [Burkholderiales bacterium]
MLESATGSMTVPVVILALLCIVIVLLLMVIWSIKRHRDPHLKIECDAPLVELARSLTGLTQGRLIEGNSVELFQNGPFFDVLLEDMRSARETLHFETFLWKEGVLGKRVADVLSERARAGVKVRVLLDATGTKKMGKDTERQLQEAGCSIAKYHARRLRNIGVMNHRDHRKIVVIDGRTAFVGGHCIVDEWLGNGEDRKHFRDMAVRLRGPIVHAVQSVFSENWVEETGELFAGDDVFPELERAGDVTVHAAHVKPESSAPAVKILHHMVICTARKRLWIQNPYFLPEPEAIDAFGDAVSRGVDVRVMVPSAEASDMPIVQHAAHRNFEKLLECGVRIFEYPKTLLHQKIMVVDGVWSALGSTNFDDRAFEINDEITLGFIDPVLAAELEAVFERDMKECVELEVGKWRRRGTFHKLKDHFFYLFNEQL